MLGSSTITTYVESASGIRRRTFGSYCFCGWHILSDFITFVTNIPVIPFSAATSGALVLVGVLMIDSVKNIDLKDVSEAFPAFITMITMVLCYSIADGICLSILSYVIVKLCTLQFKQLNITLIILAILFVINFVIG